ncbi:unnamed protein product [Eruca vesicaria subsp. sativa]|uniref:BHLH domain-containing protein n=1 Tax=Eruca vesicaria subsp. sativa TaxID=29727 RepID=A0ABC8KVP0_ERUVS|nr:unnamed protein product [Eruca vesicaria subsp. sativa]
MPLDTRQRDLPPQPCFEDITAPGIPLLELQARCFQPPPFQSLLWSHDKESCGKRFSISGMRSWCAAAAAATTTTPLESSQKGLMIFDQSGNQTRLLRCPFPLRFPSLAAAEPVKLSEFQHGLDKGFSEDHVTLKEFDENCVNGKESEMHEDTEEINALLYSDDDYEEDDDDCESDDDEVMSTGHSPYQVCNKRALEEIDSPCKRQKLLVDKVDNISGSSSSSSLVSSTKLPESNISTKEDTGSGLSNEQSRKDKIRTALKILESIVPGAKGNEALSLLDEAIDYLKLLKRDLISTEIKNQC